MSSVKVQPENDINSSKAEGTNCCTKYCKNKIHRIIHSDFFVLKVFQLLGVVYIAIFSFSTPPVGIRDPTSGFVIDPNSEENTANGVIYINGDYRPVVANTPAELFCLAVSRVCAFSMYPCLVVVFITKCKATINAFNRSPISLIAPNLCSDSHNFHDYSGKYIFWASLIHTIFHLIRWGLQGNMSLLWTSRAGKSGFTSMVVCPFIVLLMVYYKKIIRYEIRKGLHYLFIPFTISLCFHAPLSGIPNGGYIGIVMGSLLVLWTLDTFYVMFFMTEKIDTPIFQVLESGVQITMTVSKSFRTNIKGGLVYICVPFISLEWHAFTLFEVPENENKIQVFLEVCGDWTRALHQALERDTHRPLWVRGPFYTSFNHAMDYDNQIHVAVGSGVTPILSVSRTYAMARNVSIIWVVRDPFILEFYLEFLSHKNSGWLMVFYTGKTPLSPIFEERWSGTNIKIIKHRPVLDEVIPNLIYGTERGLRHDYASRDGLDKDRQTAVREIIDTYTSMTADGEVDKKKVIEELYLLARKHGFQLTSLIEDTEIEEELKGTDIEKEVITRLPSFVKRMKDQISTRLLTLPSTTHPLLSDEEYAPWEKNPSAHDYVKGLNRDILSTWGILYCGQNIKIRKRLNQVSKKYEIELLEEFFQW